MTQKTDYTTMLVVDQSATEVFNAINNVRGWWQGQITGSTDKLNDEFIYEMSPHHLSTQKVVEMVPNKRIVWLVTESQINFVANKNEWLHTKIIFDITTSNNQTTLSFTHQGLIPANECYSNCSGAWEQLINKSLLSLITTGKGVDVF
jgi:Activator of Hsp90 ATPase homolog 1-like protein